MAQDRPGAQREHRERGEVDGAPGDGTEGRPIGERRGRIPVLVREAVVAQERLAEIVETFVVTWSTQLEFTAEEMARLGERDAEPFEAADPAEVEAFFRPRG